MLRIGTNACLLSPAEDGAPTGKPVGRYDGRVRIATAPAGEIVTVVLPMLAKQRLMELLGVPEGKHDFVVPQDAEIGFADAADLMNVRECAFAELLDQGVLPSRGKGEARILPLNDFLIFKADNYAKRMEAIAEMVAIDEELGLR